ncbi:MAG: purine-binding chemotaxis protein CheW [Lachnospiraceae bacterium]|nr:purine-binding chemotaxis protein CheW [Lachnospiraceae bacterium]
MEDNRIEVTSTQFIVVNIGIEQYGIDIKYVDNIVRMQKITRVPKAQKFYRGVINLRGEIVPIMSIRRKFELEEDEITDKTRIIILKPEQQEPVGIIVDQVREVLSLDSDNIEKVHSDPKDEKSKYINAVGKHNGNLISILNINGVIEI